jgi:hypothetical protein
MKIVTKTPSTKTQLMLESLRKTATQTLEKKRRLGHYAVLWQDGKVVLQGEDAPDTQPPTQAAG